jgi:hypothetical protein
MQARTLHELIGQRSRHDVVKKSIARPANDLHALRADEVSSGGIDIKDARKHPQIGSALFLTHHQVDRMSQDFQPKRRIVRARVFRLGEEPRDDLSLTTSAITADDSLRVDSGERYDVILTNPPCGEKSSFGMVNEEGD